MTRPSSVVAVDSPAAEAPARSARLASLSAIVPVHDEEANLAAAADALLRVLPSVAELWELVIVDDGSRDRTGALADALARERRGVQVVHLASNSGYGAALRAGLAAARHEHVFLTDGDLQFDAGEIVRLVPELGRAELVVGYRARRADPFARRFGGRLWNLLVRALVGIAVRDANCAFKLCRRDALALRELRACGAAVSAELLATAQRRGGRIVEVPVTHRPRRAGRPSGGSLRVALRGLVELVALARRLG